MLVELEIRGATIRVWQCESDAESAQGLTGCAALDDDEGLMLPADRGLHTMGMMFPIDIVWLSEDGQTLAVDENVAPGWAKLPSKGPYALELAGGWFQRH